MHALPAYTYWIGAALFVAGYLIGRLGRRSDRTLAPPAAPPPDVRDGDIERLVRDGKAIEAIKAIRQRHGLGLKEAKQAYDALAARLGVHH